MMPEQNGRIFNHGRSMADQNVSESGFLNIMSQFGRRLDDSYSFYILILNSSMEKNPVPK